MRRLGLPELLSSTEQSVSWCRQLGLIQQQMACNICGNQMTGARHKGADELIWTCTKRLSGHRHFKRVSIREGTLFSNSKLALRDIILLIYEWSRSTKPVDAAFELALGENTVNRWYELCRKVCGLALLTRHNTQIGGPGEIVEIDECQLGRRKHHRGRPPLRFESLEVLLVGQIL
jgi:hypothetical protein